MLALISLNTTQPESHVTEQCIALELTKKKEKKMIKYSKNNHDANKASCCISSSGSDKVSYTSQAEAGAVANRLGSKVYQCRVNPANYHITSQGNSPAKMKPVATDLKDIKREKRKTSRELNALLMEVNKQIEKLYEQEKTVASAWSQEQLDEFYRREQELLTTEELLIEELDEEYIWMKVLK